MRAAALMINEAKKQRLEAWARAGTTPPRVTRKGKVILVAIRGSPTIPLCNKPGCRALRFWPRSSPAISHGERFRFTVLA